MKNKFLKSLINVFLFFTLFFPNKIKAFDSEQIKNILSGALGGGLLVGGICWLYDGLMRQNGEDKNPGELKAQIETIKRLYARFDSNLSITFCAQLINSLNQQPHVVAQKMHQELTKIDQLIIQTKLKQAERQKKDPKLAENVQKLITEAEQLKSFATEMMQFINKQELSISLRLLLQKIHPVNDPIKNILSRQYRDSDEFSKQLCDLAKQLKHEEQFYIVKFVQDISNIKNLLDEKIIYLHKIKDPTDEQMTLLKEARERKYDFEQAVGYLHNAYEGQLIAYKLDEKERKSQEERLLAQKNAVEHERTLQLHYENENKKLAALMLGQETMRAAEQHAEKEAEMKRAQYEMEQHRFNVEEEVRKKTDSFNSTLQEREFFIKQEREKNKKLQEEKEDYKKQIENLQKTLSDLRTKMQSSQQKKSELVHRIEAIDQKILNVKNRQLPVNPELIEPELETHLQNIQDELTEIHNQIQTELNKK